MSLWVKHRGCIFSAQTFNLSFLYQNIVLFVAVKSGTIYFYGTSWSGLLRTWLSPLGTRRHCHAL